MSTISPQGVSACWAVALIIVGLIALAMHLHDGHQIRDRPVNQLARGLMYVAAFLAVLLISRVVPLVFT